MLSSRDIAYVQNRLDTLIVSHERKLKSAETALNLSLTYPVVLDKEKRKKVEQCIRFRRSAVFLLKRTKRRFTGSALTWIRDQCILYEGLMDDINECKSLSLP